MKKIKVLTIHCIHNFGSVFQSYGLVEFLRSSGYDAELIDYRPFYYKKGRNIIKKFLGIALNFSYYRRQHKKYSYFIENYLPKGRCYQTFEQMKQMENEISIFIAGGDQIWNNFHPCGRDNAYKLTFVNSGKKIAYGTSMGRNTYSPLELQELSKLINDFSAIGLREQSTVALLQPYVRVPVYHAADPVLLLESSKYMKFIGDKRLIKEPYIVMYLAAKTDLLQETVEYIAKARNLKIVHVCGFTKKCKCDYFLKDTGPEELLNLIYYSNFVVSASFHATLFSILFNKQFCTLLPEAGTNTRIEDLLSKFNLSDRIIRLDMDLKRLDIDIDFVPINDMLNGFVKESKVKLINSIEK